jgi:hypothetical protein
MGLGQTAEERAQEPARITADRGFGYGSGGPGLRVCGTNGKTERGTEREENPQWGFLATGQLAGRLG